MTPALLDALARVHRRVNDPKGGGASAEAGDAADLVMLAGMKAV